MVALTICGTASRAKRARNLQRRLGCQLVIDTHGEPTLNHARAWRTSIATADAIGDQWCGVVEDDAICSPTLAEHLDRYLEAIPGDCGLVSAYLGTGVPRGQQGRIQQALESFTTPGIVVSRVGPLSHVAVFARTSIASQIPEMMESKPGMACDTLLDVWCQNQRILTAMPIPSWFDHSDMQTTVKHTVDVSMPRKAHRYDDSHWSPGAAVALYPNTPGYECLV